MSSIIVIDRLGKEHKLNADSNSTLMEIIRNHGMDIEAACGGCCACATCHLYVDEKWLDKLPQIEDDEEAMLDQAFEVKSNSRLGCQIDFTEDIEGIIVELAPD